MLSMISKLTGENSQPDVCNSHNNNYAGIMPGIYNCQHIGPGPTPHCQQQYLRLTISCLQIGHPWPIMLKFSM